MIKPSRLTPSVRRVFCIVWGMRFQYKASILRAVTEQTRIVEKRYKHHYFSWASSTLCIGKRQSSGRCGAAFCSPAVGQNLSGYGVKRGGDDAIWTFW